jgi:hypothetical protein
MLVTDACASRDLSFDGVSIPAAQVHAAFLAALGAGFATLHTTNDICVAF